MAETQSAVQSKVEFFKPQHVTGNTTKWADWELQTGGNPTISRQRAQTLKENGDELNTVQYGVQVSYTENFKAKKVSGTGGYAVPCAGEIKDGAHIDGIQVGYTQNDAPTLVINSHQHGADVAGVFTPSTHDACRVYEPSVILPIRAVGVPSVLKFKNGTSSEASVFTLPSGIGMRSLQYSLQATHVDEPDGDGNHLAGQNHDGVETLTIEFTGKVVVSELSINSAWLLPDSDADGQGNTQATTKSITLTRHIPYSTTKTPAGGEK